jgi:hypothetical protein
VTHDQQIGKGWLGNLNALNAQPGRCPYIFPRQQHKWWMTCVLKSETPVTGCFWIPKFNTFTRRHRCLRI